MNLLILPTEVAIPRSRLRDLERIDRAHTAYLNATCRMRERLALLDVEQPPTPWLVGYRTALSDFAGFVVRP